MSYERVELANNEAVKRIIHSEPYWVDVLPAEDVLENFDGNTILHSGPPIEYERMCFLHKRGMINAVLFEGWANDEKTADELLLSGKIKVDSAFNYNTVGSGTGIITKSTPLLVVEDKTTKRKAGVFPHEGKFGGGFCGWGVFSKEIAANLNYMRDELFKSVCGKLHEIGGIPLKPFISQSLCMGDENHSNQTAVDAIFIRELLPLLLECSNYNEIISYFVLSKRFFHNFGQAACRSGLVSAEGIEWSSMVTAAGGNGVEYGIMVAGLPGEWFTAESPMIKGKYMVEKACVENQLPWIGDSSVVECAGLGGILSAASPVVCSYRNELLTDGINTTKRMEEISIAKNSSYNIPNLDFDNPPVGIDILKVESTGILPVINGGMIDKNGGWLGAGYACIPMECFVKASRRFKEVYGIK